MRAVIPSPERLQETQLGALGVPSQDFIYSYNGTNGRKCDDSYDRVAHMNNTTTRHHDSHTTSAYIIPRHHVSSYITYDVTTPRPPVWPHSYVPVDYTWSRRYGQYQLGGLIGRVNSFVWEVLDRIVGSSE